MKIGQLSYLPLKKKLLFPNLLEPRQLLSGKPFAADVEGVLPLCDIEILFRRVILVVPDNQVKDI